MKRETKVDGVGTIQELKVWPKKNLVGKERAVSEVVFGLYLMAETFVSRRGL